MSAVADTWYMTGRAFRAFLRQPMYVAFTLIQPMIWLLLFGQLFKSVTEIPGFGASNYETYLVPSIVVMSGFFGAGWGGMATLVAGRGALGENPDRGTILENLGYLAVLMVICAWVSTRAFRSYQRSM